jgi:hypothetical protein
MIQATEVQKENISELKFVSVNDPSDPASAAQLRSDLSRAILLGNADHQKVKIIFETTEGPMFTDTTVWNLTENYIILKGNVDVPIRAIRRIEFFE